MGEAAATAVDKREKRTSSQPHQQRGSRVHEVQTGHRVGERDSIAVWTAVGRSSRRQAVSRRPLDMAAASSETAVRERRVEASRPCQDGEKSSGHAQKQIQTRQPLSLRKECGRRGEGLGSPPHFP